MSARRAVVVCDDVSRLPARLKSLAFGPLGATLRRFVARVAQGSERTWLLGSPELAGSALPGAEVVDMAHVLVSGGSACDVEALSAFASHVAGRLDESLRGGPGEGAGTLAEMRLVVGPLLEYLARPAEAMLGFYRETGATDVFAFSHGTAASRIALGTAESAGLRTHEAPFSPWRAFWSLKHAVWSRNRFLPRPARIAELWAQAKAPAPAPDPTEILIFAEEERRLRRAKEMARAMQAAGMKVRVVTVPFKPDAVAALREIAALGVPTSFLPHYLPFSAEERAPELLARFAKAWHALERDPAVAGFRYRGVPCWSVFRKFLRRGWPSFALAGAFAREASHAILDAHRPGKVIVMEVGIYSKALLDAAKARGARTYWYANNPLLFTIQHWLPLTLRVFRAHEVITTGEIMGEQLVARGFYREQEIVPAGDVNLAPTLAPEAAAARAETLRKKHGVPPGKPVVLVLSSYLAADVTAEKLRRFHTEAAALAKSAGALVWVKAHPSQDPAALARELAEWGAPADAVFHVDPLMELLSASDLAIMMFSQAGSEVLLAGIPLVILQDEKMVSQYDDQFPYVREGGAALLPLGSPGNAALLRALLPGGPARAERLRQGDRLLRRYVSVRHPDNAAYLAERLRT